EVSCTTPLRVQTSPRQRVCSSPQLLKTRLQHLLPHLTLCNVWCIEQRVRSHRSLAWRIQMKHEWTRNCLNLFLAISLVAGSVLHARGQTASTGALTGTVIDQNKAAVADVQITLVNEVTGETRTVVSQQSGNYVIPLLQPGSYQIEMIKTGFKKAVKSGLR